MEHTQLTIGQLLDKLESIDLKSESGKEKQVYYDFGSAIPTSIDSWRGSYAEAALGYRLTGYDATEHFGSKPLSELIAELKNVNNRSYEGWKGGDFYYDKDTPLWVANSGNSGSTAIYDVLDDGWRVVLLTCYWEY